MPAIDDPRAGEIGLVGYNGGSRTSITQSCADRGIDYEEIAEYHVEGRQVTVYQYDKDGETRYAAEWGKRVMIDDVVWASLVFESEPDPDAISRGHLIALAETEDDD